MSKKGNKLANILIIDDEKEICLYLEELLTENDFVVLTAENGIKGLEIIKNEKVDVVLADIVMPKIDGIALTRSIKEMNQDIPVILMTAYSSIEYAVESMKAGAADFISKPFKINYALFIINKVLETKRLEKKAKKTEYYRKLSNIDALTSIHNYRFFKEILDNEIKRHKRYERNLSFLLIDIDDFKSINDTYGHLTGDIVLKKIARLLSKTVRSCDFLARYGGEEFAVILPETSEKEALMLGKRIVSIIENHKFKSVEGEPIIKISVTVGLTSFPRNASNLKQLIDRADQALYKGKRLGKNRITVF